MTHRPTRVDPLQAAKLAGGCYNMLAPTLGGIEIDLSDGSPS